MAVYPNEPRLAREPNPLYRVPLLGARGGSVPCRITCYSEGQTFTLNGRPGRGASDLDAQVLSFETHKDLNTPAGSFSVTLWDRPLPDGPFKGLHLGDVLKPMDLVVLSFGRTESGKNQPRRVASSGTEGMSAALQGVMIGVVGQRPTEAEEVSESGEVIHTVSVSGFDLGKLLLSAQIYRFRDVPLADLETFAAAGWKILRDARGMFPLAPQHEVARIILDSIFYKSLVVSYRRPLVAAAPDFNTRDVLGYQLAPMTVVNGAPANLPVPLQFFAQERDVHSLLAYVAQDIWGEVWVDTWPDEAAFWQGMVPAGGANLLPQPFDGVRAFVAMRDVPFTEAAWSNLPGYMIDDSVVLSANLGGEPTLYNVFHAKPTGMGVYDVLTNAALTGAPILNEDSLQRHGYRPLVAESIMFPFANSNEQVKTIQDFASHQTKLLYNHHASSAQFVSGTLTVQGNPAYRVGTRLIRAYAYREGLDHERRVRDFYLEGVSHSWQAFGTCTTTLRVTRGLDEGDTALRFPVPPTPSYQQSVEWPLRVSQA